ncbi:MAG: co-chaperone GroES [Patescibacteria group bacterium]|jgi:chaperonin GroES|nr:co-chaperone GroES [Patescibacteria group bacterium]
MNLKPLHDNVIVKPDAQEEMTKSGIVLPGNAEQEKPVHGKVLAVGDGLFFENGQKKKMSVKVGDNVVFKKYSPDEITVEGEEYLVIKENDIVAIIN